MDSSNDWSRFAGGSIPSSLDLQSDIFTKLKKEDKVLDFGCGFGKTCFDLYAKGFRSITGADINKNGIEYAQNFAKNNRITELEFFVENVTKLSFKHNSFSFGIMQALLTAIPEDIERQLIFSEASRVLCPGGCLYVAVFAQSWHVSIYRKRYLSAISKGYQKGSFPVFNPESGELEYVARHYTEEEITTLLINARFKIESFRYEKFTTRSGNKVNGMVIIAKNSKRKIKP